MVSFIDYWTVIVNINFVLSDDNGIIIRDVIVFIVTVTVIAIITDFVITIADAIIVESLLQMMVNYFMFTYRLSMVKTVIYVTVTVFIIVKYDDDYMIVVIVINNSATVIIVLSS